MNDAPWTDACKTKIDSTIQIEAHNLLTWTVEGPCPREILPHILSDPYYVQSKSINIQRPKGLRGFELIKHAPKNPISQIGPEGEGLGGVGTGD